MIERIDMTAVKENLKMNGQITRHVYIYIYMYSLPKCSQQISFFSSANSTLVKEPGGSVKDLAVSAPVAPKAIPQRLGDTEPCWKIFHRKDDRFLQPKVPLKRVTK